MRENLDRIVKKIRSEGLIALLKSAPKTSVSYMRPYVVLTMYKILHTCLSGRIIQGEELKGIAHEKGGWLDLGPANITEVPTSANLPPDLIDYTGNYTGRRQFVAEIPGARLTGHDGIVLDPDGNIILESLGGHPWFLGYVVYRYLAEGRYTSLGDLFTGIKSDRRRYGTVFPLLGPHSRTYFHWLTEFLPRLRFLQAWESETGREAKILVNPDPPAWKIQSIKNLGYESTKWVEYTGAGIADEVLITPYSPKRPNLYVPSLRGYRWLREQSVAAEWKYSFNDIIYVSRSDAPNRRIVNEEELINQFPPDKIVRVVPSELSFKQQVGVFSQAEVVIGPHGAGLANAIFGDDLTMIECFQPDNIRGHFFQQAMLLDHSYECIIGERRGKNMYVRPEQVKSAVGRVR